ncbi:MAG TPA: phosphatase PAP2 family protein [Thermoanaerobaculia bacterium]|nr:phosphatase PAP2 family protein [Thermoanaerobaculia bacterium]
MKPKVLFKTLWVDAKHILPAPFHWDGHDWLVFSAGVAATTVFFPYDQEISEKARRDTTPLGEVGTQLEGLGDARSIALLFGFYGAGAIIRDQKAKDVCIDGLVASTLAAGIVTPIVSTVVGRERPTQDMGAFAFHPFEGRSFPGGHVTQTFAVVSVIASSYDQWWVKVAAYGAGLVSVYERVRRGKHFLSDNVAGAFIGTAIGTSVVRYNRKLRSGEVTGEVERPRPGPALTLYPFAVEGGLGLGGTFSF